MLPYSNPGLTKDVYMVLMTRHFDYCPSASEGDNQSVRSSAPVVSRCFPGGYNVKLYISRGRLAWRLLAFLHSDSVTWSFKFKHGYQVRIHYNSNVAGGVIKHNTCILRCNVVCL